MFVSHEKNNGKKIYQKPNILRKKPKVSSIKYSGSEGHESLDSNFSQNFDLSLSKVGNLQRTLSKKNKIHGHALKKPAKLKDKLLITQTQDASKKCDQSKMDEEIEHFNSTEDFLHQSQINIDSFLNEDVSSQNILFDIDISTGKNIDCNSQSKWCFNFMDDTQVVLENYTGDDIGDTCIVNNKDLVTNMVPLSEVSSLNQNNQFVDENELESVPTPIQNFTIDQFSQKRAKFVCEKPDCNKKFMSEQKLKKHLESHNKEANGRLPRQVTNECPVKKVDADGTELRCGKTFLVKEDLVKHLNEDHSPEEAPYECSLCSRRFFFAAGLRAHGRAHSATREVPRLRCAWPGCGREFRLPCRLREHTRAHTGDKPYHCPYPSCEWSFRTASKLLRHARRHTGERRHVCSACGRAFLRREHLRDHAARHRPEPELQPAPTHADCDQTFPTTKLVGVHVKRGNKKEKKSTSRNKPEVPLIELKAEPDDIFTLNLREDSLEKPESTNETGLDDIVLQEGEESVKGLQCVTSTEGAEPNDGAGPNDGAELHAARTHCTWPLQRNYALSDAVLVVEEDYQNEPSESSESNIYTVKSDLFLHGNLLNNEDSEQMAPDGMVCPGGQSRVAGPDGAPDGVPDGAPDALDGSAAGLDLGLLDTHSTIDLMQEELMYTDAVDESSFQVLLRGEL